MRLSGKVAIITGAASGIGKETALLFAQEGAIVVVADINEQAGKETVNELKSYGDASFFKLDVAKAEQINEMILEIIERYHKIDILINNAGVTQDALLLKMTEAQWDCVIDINLKGVFNCTKAVASIMVKQGQGVIINASSVVGLNGNIGQANYAAAKSGLIGLTKALAKELGKKGVRVNAVAPGFIISPMTASVPEKVLKSMEEKTPLGKLGEPQDVAYAYLYLASDEAKFVNGSVLCVDGGLVI